MAIEGMDKFRKNIDKAIRDRRVNLRKTLNAIGNNHVLEGSKRAPIDKGFLRVGIVKQVYDSSVVIRVPVNSTASDYVLSMHEDYYNLGINSLDAQNRSDVQVGRKFLTRGREAASARDKKFIKLYLSV
jgi:hypothetical protein